MNSVFDVLDSEVTLQQLMNVSPDGTHQFWDVGGGRGLEADLTVNLVGQSFSASFDNLELHSSTTDESDATRIWKLTNIPMTVTGNFTLVGVDTITVNVSVTDMWQGTISVDYNTGELLQFSDSFTGSYPGFAEYILRQADTITGSSGKDTLLGFGGNDKINGGGGADVINGGVGGDVINGESGNDKITWGAGDKVNGGAGSGDVLKLGVSLNLVPLSKKVLGTEIIDMRGSGNDKLTLNATDVLEMPGDRIRILGDTNDIVDISGSNGTRTTVGGFYQYKVGGATLLIEQDVNVV
jgi:Ca2+-binding RTX toxin-like protein